MTTDPAAAKDAPETEDEQVFNFDVGRYLRALKRYAWIVIALVALAVTAAVFHTRRLPKIYQATASVQIEPKIVDLLGKGELVPNWIGGADYYRQQQQVLGSIKLLRETVVAANLHHRLLP